MAKANDNMTSNFGVEYDYSHVPTIRKFAQSDKRIRCIIGPVGSGKSSGCVMEIIRRSFMQMPNEYGIRKTRWAVIRSSYPKLRDTTIKTFLDWFPPKAFGEYKITEHRYTITRFAGVECEILFRALDTPEHVGNLLSLDLTGAWINEVSEIQRPIFEALDGRIGRYPSKKDGGSTWHGIIMDTNPPEEGSWLHKYLEEEKPDNMKLFKQPSGLSQKAENLHNLIDGYYTNMVKGKTQDFVKVYIEAQYGMVRDGKAVFSNWRPELHVAKEEIKPMIGVDVLIGLDYGLTPAAVICQVTPRGKLHVLDELIGSGIGIRGFAMNQLLPLLNTKYKGMNIVGSGDPAGTQRSQTNEKTCYDELHELGLRIRPASTNALAARLDAVNYFLSRLVDGDPCFQINPACKTLIKGFNGHYKFRRIVGSGDRYTDVPAKNEYSHINDALQYACLYIEEQIRSIRKSSSIAPRRYMPATYAGY